MIIKIAGAIAVLAISFFTALWVMGPAGPDMSQRPALTPPPPLPAITRASQIIAPVAISLSAISATLDNAAPRNLAGKGDNPLRQLLAKAVIDWNVTRGPMSVTSQSNAMLITTPLNGTLHITGELGQQAGNIGGQLGNLINSNVGRALQGVTGKTFDQRAEIRGAVLVNARPNLTPNWRIDPNMSAQVNIAEGGLAIAGVRVSAPAQIKPLLDKNVAEQVAALQARIRNDPVVEQTARREWAKMCRSIEIGGGKADMPPLWLEMRPVRAYSAQPKVESGALTLTVGVQAETRISPAKTTPQCPFPAQLDIVPQSERGRLNVAVPIDVPFPVLNKLLEAQLKGRTFPDDGSSAAAATVKSASLAASGDRLLITLLVNVKETKSWFGLGADATVHVWGKPVLDTEKQILKFADVDVAIESQAAFGLAGSAAQAAVPYLREALRDQANVDLKSLLGTARKGIDGALADFTKAVDGVTVNANIDDLRVADLAFDANTLRVIAEAKGGVQVAVSKLPQM